jgi:hypothetical protein
MSWTCFVKMDKLEYRTVIKFVVLGGLTPKEIHPKLTKGYGNSAPSISTVKKWPDEFKHGCSKMTHVTDGKKLQ